MFTGTLPEQVNYQKLARENRKLEGVIPVSSFQRLNESLEKDAGQVNLKIEFRKGRKHTTHLIGKASANLTVLCQRCLAEMPYKLDVSIRYTVASSEEALMDLPQDDDALLCTEERMSLVSIFEDEFIVNLPMVTMHALEDGLDTKGAEDNSSVGRCKVDHINDNSPIKPTTHRPFAGLADIKNDFKRS